MNPKPQVPSPRPRPIFVSAFGVMGIITMCNCWKENAVDIRRDRYPRPRGEHADISLVAVRPLDCHGKHDLTLTDYHTKASKLISHLRPRQLFSVFKHYARADLNHLASTKLTQVFVSSSPLSHGGLQRVYWSVPAARSGLQ